MTYYNFVPQKFKGSNNNKTRRSNLHVTYKKIG